MKSFSIKATLSRMFGSKPKPQTLVEKREYPELAGKEVLFIQPSGVTVEAYIVACDYYLGYTLVDKHNHDRFLVCARGPLAPEIRDVWDSEMEVAWDKIWEEDVTQLLVGYLNSTSNSEYVGSSPSRNTCAFN